MLSVDIKDMLLKSRGEEDHEEEEEEEDKMQGGKTKMKEVEDKRQKWRRRGGRVAGISGGRGTKERNIRIERDRERRIWKKKRRERRRRRIRKKWRKMKKRMLAR